MLVSLRVMKTDKLGGNMTRRIRKGEHALGGAVWVRLAINVGSSQGRFDKFVCSTRWDSMSSFEIRQVRFQQPHVHNILICHINEVIINKSGWESAGLRDVGSNLDQPSSGSTFRQSLTPGRHKNATTIIKRFPAGNKAFS